MKNKKIIISIILAIVILSVAGGFYAKSSKQEIKLPQSPEELREFADSNDFKAMDEKTRREVMRKSMQQQFDNTLNEYFALEEKDKSAYLDDVIDRMGQMRARWRSRRNRDNEDGQQRPRRMPSAERMRERTESMDPERLARMVEFMKAMQKRMGERGIESGFGGRH
ncbi:MAG: hypothetical protein KAS96_03090 [Planctomycetes bacterium]|nr:hypothetical protein [Planctomycetota bacterium]